MKSIVKAYSKCFLCIKDGSAAEKDVIEFYNYGVCLCEKHLNKIIGEYLNLKPQREVGSDK